MGIIKRRIARGLQRSGFVVTRTPGAGTLARHLREVFSVVDVDCVIDVGANRGQFGQMLRAEVGFRGRIASVEPSPSIFEELIVVTADDPAWLTFNFGLGDVSGEAILHTHEADDFNSLHALNDYGAKRFDLHEVGTEPIVVHRLDAVFDQLAGDCSRVFLKCDTQGHDLSVLAGLGDRTIVGLQLELSFIGIYEGAPGHLEALAEVGRLGYTPSGFFPITRHSDGLALVEADGVFVAHAKLDRH
jgi:FkbM family methyltransferase